MTSAVIAPSAPLPYVWFERTADLPRSSVRRRALLAMALTISLSLGGVLGVAQIRHHASASQCTHSTSTTGGSLGAVDDSGEFVDGTGSCGLPQSSGAVLEAPTTVSASSADDDAAIAPALDAAVVPASS